MAKVPSGQTAATWDGSGKVWFKIYQDMPTTSGGQYTWPSNGNSSSSPFSPINLANKPALLGGTLLTRPSGKSQIPFTVPQCLAEGDYLFRVEHVALHSASSAGGAQFYLSCAQLRVTGGGSGSAKEPGELVSFPGAYKATDPGIMINIYNNGGKAYQPAGPGVFSC